MASARAIAYEDIEAANHSLLKHHFKSPAHVKEVMDNGTGFADHLNLGSLFHLAVLEPHRLSEVYVYDKFDGRTKAGKAKLKELTEARESGVITAMREELEKVSRMAESVFNHSDASAIVSAVSETEKVLQAELNGLPCKGLTDFYSEKGRFLGDLKTTAKGARFHNFQRDAGKFDYYTQAAFYLMLCKAEGIPADAFFWVVVETDAPFVTYAYQLSEVTKAACDLAIENLLERHKVCLHTGHWPPPNEPVQPLDAPDFYFSKLEALK